MRIIFLLPVFVLFTLLSKGQNADIDKLKKEISRHPQQDAYRVDRLNKIAEISNNILSDDEREKLIDEALLISRSIKYPVGEGFALLNLAMGRNLLGGKKLFDELGSKRSAGTYCINIEGDKRKKQLKRKATLEVRFCKIEILKTDGASKQIAKTVQLYAVEAREINTSASQPVCWRINTSLPVTNIAEALRVIEWYSWRWMIEEVFRIAKEEGFINLPIIHIHNCYTVKDRRFKTEIF